MELNTKVNFNLDPNMDKVSMSGQINHITKAIGKITSSKGTVNICGPMAENTSAVGRTIKWTEKGNSSTRMAEFSEEPIKMTRRMASVFVSGQTGRRLKEIGLMVNNKESVK